MTERSVLITGAAGFIGSHLAERCLAHGWRVTGVDSFTDYYDEQLKRRNVASALEHPRYELIEGDLLELELEEPVNSAGSIFHLAAQPGVRTSWERFELYVRQNVTSTVRLLELARSARADRVIIASSSSVYGDAETLPSREELSPRPVSPYGVTKVAAEHLAHAYWRNFGVPTVCLRYFTVFGPRQRPDMAFNRLISGALAGEPFEVYGDGRQTRDFTFVADAITGTVTASERARPGSTYNIGGGSRRSVQDVLETLGALLGRPVERTYGEERPGDARDTAADISRARLELGYEPSFAFDRGLELQLEWQQALLEATEPSP